VGRFIYNDIMNLPEKIETDRLVLVPISEKYKQEMFDNLTSEITRYMLVATPKDISETESFVSMAIQKNREGTDFFVTFLSKDGEFIGNGGLHKIDTKNPEFGVWIKKSAHGKGLGREAMMAIKDWADDNLDYEYLVYPVDERNVTSRKIPEAMGGVIAGKRNHENGNGEELKTVEYRIYRKK